MSGPYKGTCWFIPFQGRTVKAGVGKITKFLKMQLPTTWLAAVKVFELLDQAPLIVTGALLQLTPPTLILMPERVAVVVLVACNCHGSPEDEIVPQRGEASEVKLAT